MLSRLSVAVLLLLGHIGVAFAAQSGECTRKTSTLPGAWLEHRQGEFIYQYTLEGEHALKEPDTVPGKSVPAVVQDAALQMHTTRALFQQLGYQLPLDSARYKGQGATHVLVRFTNIRGMGQAFDEVSRMPSGECVLGIVLASRLKTGNLSPAHEYFHQIQNGYAPFKRAWFYEGTARWSELILSDRSAALRPVPQSPEQLAQLWQESYSAVSVWNALAEQCDPKGYRLPLSAQWRNLRYSNGDAVVLDDVLPGHGFMLRVLKALGALGERLSPQEGVPPHRWPEALQRDPKHDAAMWQAVQQACTP
jgi:hypothetical protein